MSQKRRARDYSSLPDADIRHLRRGSGGGATVGGYLPSNGGAPKPNPGDEKFPYFKDPPDIENPTRYIAPATFTGAVVDNPIPLVAAFSDYLVLDTIDVGGFRLLKLFVEFFPGDDTIDGILSVLFEESLGDADEWFPMGVVNGTITQSAITGAQLGFRDTFGAELRFNEPGGGVVVPNGIRRTLTFDVTQQHNVRLLVGDISVATSGLNLWYMRGR